MLDFKLDEKAAVNSLLFVIDNLKKSDAHKIYKILYFADKKHLLKYVRPIFGDTYIRMEFGPVPSFLKNVVDGNTEYFEKVVEKIPEKKHKYSVKALVKPNLDFLSESDLECLKESIAENKDLSFQQLTNKSHDSAYHKAKPNGDINYLDIAEAGGADENLLYFIKQQQINDNLELA